MFIFSIQIHKQMTISYVEGIYKNILGNPTIPSNDSQPIYVVEIARKIS